ERAGGAGGGGVRGGGGTPPAGGGGARPVGERGDAGRERRRHEPQPHPQGRGAAREQALGQGSKRVGWGGCRAGHAKPECSSCAPLPGARRRWQAPAMPRRVAAVWSPRYACDIGAHVFPTEKYAAVRRALVDSGDLEADADLAPPAATRALLERAHDAAYLDDLEALRWAPRTQYRELPLTREIVDAFSLAASGTTRAARLALELGAAAHLGGGLHHAYAGHAEGFCYVNDLAVAARVLLAEGGVRRVAVVDLDVHQGNGTAHIFRDEPAVFTLSIHQENNYPVPKERSDLDVGLEDGTGDDAYLAALAPALDRVWTFAPDLVLYQAGADPFHDD